MKIVVLIPTYNPKDKIKKVIKILEENNFKDIIIVNDGSNNEHLINLKDIKYPILNHEINMGKGAALKTGFNYILKNFKDVDGVLTIDDDMQHDIESVKNLVKKFNGETVIGVRNFDVKGVPTHRKFGNKLSAYIFKKLYKFDVKDTQTGLRIYSKSCINHIINLESTGFEYELEALIYMIKKKEKIKIVPINTIYNKEPNTSRYKPIKDSIRVYKIMLINGRKLK